MSKLHKFIMWNCASCFSPISKETCLEAVTLSTFEIFEMDLVMTHMATIGYQSLWHSHLYSWAKLETRVSSSSTSPSLAESRWRISSWNSKDLNWEPISTIGSHINHCLKFKQYTQIHSQHPAPTRSNTDHTPITAVYVDVLNLL